MAHFIVIFQKKKKKKKLTCGQLYLKKEKTTEGKECEKREWKGMREG